MNTLIFHLLAAAKKMWVRCCLFCLFAIIALAIGATLGHHVPNELKEVISISAVDNILKILASSMLAVTTFSLSIMVQAFNAAATTASPRASKLLMQDSTAQNALGAFIGAFLFSIVGIVGINASVYTDGAIVILFLFTTIIIVIIIVMLLKWIDQLSKLGRVSETIELVERALEKSIIDRAKQPYLYSNYFEMHSLNRESMHPIVSDKIGYVQYIDVEALNKIAKKNNTHIYITINPGKFLNSIEPFGYTKNNLDDTEIKKITNSIIIGKDRTFEQDPRYGFIVLSEIALKAISPAINDPGTAISIIGSYIRSAKLWGDAFFEKGEGFNCEISTNVKYKHVSILPIETIDILKDMYGVLIADASNNFSISMHIKKSLLTIESLHKKQFSNAAQHWESNLKIMCKDRLTTHEYDQLFE